MNCEENRMEELIKNMVGNFDDFDDHVLEIAEASEDADNSLLNFMGNTVDACKELLRRIEAVEKLQCHCPYRNEEDEE